MPVKNNALLVTTTLLFSLLSWVHAGPLEDGHDAFDAGEYQKALEIWLPLAEAGNADAQFNVGMLYQLKLPKEKNDPGFPGCEQYDYTFALNTNCDSKIRAKNDKLALDWSIKSAEQGIADAQYNVGLMYYEGRGAYPNHKTAVEYWQLAASRGHANSQFNLGVMYAYGYGINPNKNQAVNLWTLAANQGHPGAIDALIAVYRGDFPGVEADEQKLNYWLNRR